MVLGKYIQVGKKQSKNMVIDISLTGRRVKTIIDEVGMLADRRKMKAYIVGGIVRDILLQKDNFDLDIVVEGNAISLARSFAKAQKAKITEHKKFGTATVLFFDGFAVDFATARKEEYRHPGALPTVKPGTIRDDLFRRDFTINALAIGISNPSYGELIDFCGGLEDIRKRKIRVLHNRSFIDDPTRILRAVRFEQRFDFSMGRSTLCLLKEAIFKKAISRVKAPRYFSEFRKILSEPAPLKSIRRLSLLNGFEFLGESFKPKVRVLSLMSSRLKVIKKEFFYDNIDWSRIYLAVLIGEMELSEIKKWARQLHLIKEEQLLLKMMNQVAAIIKKLGKGHLNPSDVYKILNLFSQEEVCLMRVSTSSNRISRYIDDYLLKTRFVKLFVTGDDLKKQKGLTGKGIGDILDSLLMKKIDGLLKSRKDEERALRKILSASIN